ncbi:MAG: type II toxin-antitoxin system HicB family antitoxin [Microcystis aeruginosa Ma_MB_F_20061100_S20]|uniref:Type II toxin-antitoxin system HicB family antitoxin n=1 Tax=Microcystis aeruginosa Ma_MB_F_20061100_S20D TaxID=2486253 RepID=A0A552ELH3_MICAE|nr:MAG: type II toxin-antitoxin system HicB family antitoxin [Microcystis aeruginosa Ma_MB_F_20061100_S20D]TRU37918.1 MAG: type II toxin-antitoxin system HicB family antitoxin [Microcystis aeruginosa Ma_MB_F_20061100_S20]
MEQQILEYFLSLKYPISIYSEEEGGYTALIPDLPGCMSRGETLEEVIINIEEAVVKKQLLCFLKDKKISS